MKITVIDLESTCWEDKKFQQQYSEIIEIGCVSFDSYTGIIDNARSIYVKPALPISIYCNELTGITQKVIDKQGKSLKDAIAELKKYYKTNKTWVSWGTYDYVMLKKECNNKNVEFPFKEGNHVNLKNIHAIMEDVKPMGLKRALDYYGIKFEGNHHSGKDDAYNTARIFKEIYLKGK